MSEDRIGAIIFFVWMAFWIAIARWRRWREMPIEEWIRGNRCWVNRGEIHDGARL